MKKLTLSLNTDLCINAGDIDIAVSPAANNAFQLKADGIFINDELVSTGEGFVDQTSDGMRIGFLGPFDGKVNGQYPVPGRVSANNTVHRTWTAEPETVPDKFRPVDTVLPGDIIREPSDDKYKYYLVTNVTIGSSDTGFVNNEVASYVYLGKW